MVEFTAPPKKPKTMKKDWLTFRTRGISNVSSGHDGLFGQRFGKWAMRNGIRESMNESEIASAIQIEIGTVEEWKKARAAWK